MQDFAERRATCQHIIDARGRLAGTFAGNAKIAAPPYDAITFDLDALWPFGQHPDNA